MKRTMNGKLMIALHGDTALAAADTPLLQSAAVGGVILFARNYKNREQLRELTDNIRRINSKLIIAADQEGGRVQRFCDDSFTRIPPMKILAQQANAEELIRAAGVVLATELIDGGVDLSFAPVLDIAHGHSAVIGDRAFSNEPAAVAHFAAQLIAGLKLGGMLCCGKHFPGHGYAVADSHTTLPRDERTRDEIFSADLIPFRRLAKTLPLIMTAHIVYPAVDDLPATFSSVWLKNILRQQLNFTGLTVCDDLSMTGAASIGDVGARLCAADSAGCDLFLVCQKADITAAVTAAEKITTTDGNSNGGDNESDGDAQTGWKKFRARPPTVDKANNKKYQQARQTLKIPLHLKDYRAD